MFCTVFLKFYLSPSLNSSWTHPRKKTMFPLKPLLPLTPAPEQHPSGTPVTHTKKSSADRDDQQQADWPQRDRRINDRRQLERRSSQSAILLNTRKAQGRRKSIGRRVSDLPAGGNTHLSISVRG